MPGNYGIHGQWVSGPDWVRVEAGCYVHETLGTIKRESPLCWWRYPDGLAGCRVGPYVTFSFAAKMARLDPDAR